MSLAASVPRKNFTQVFSIFLDGKKPSATHPHNRVLEGKLYLEMLIFEGAGGVGTGARLENEDADGGEIAVRASSRVDPSRV